LRVKKKKKKSWMGLARRFIPRGIALGG